MCRRDPGDGVDLVDAGGRVGSAHHHFDGGPRHGSHDGTGAGRTGGGSGGARRAGQGQQLQISSKGWRRINIT